MADSTSRGARSGNRVALGEGLSTSNFIPARPSSALRPPSRGGQATNTTSNSTAKKGPATLPAAFLEPTGVPAPAAPPHAGLSAAYDPQLEGTQFRNLMYNMRTVPRPVEALGAHVTKKSAALSAHLDSFQHATLGGTAEVPPKQKPDSFVPGNVAYLDRALTNLQTQPSVLSHRHRVAPKVGLAEDPNDVPALVLSSKFAASRLTGRDTEESSPKPYGVKATTSVPPWTKATAQPWAPETGIRTISHHREAAQQRVDAEVPGYVLRDDLLPREGDQGVPPHVAARPVEDAVTGGHFGDTMAPGSMLRETIHPHEMQRTQEVEAMTHGTRKPLGYTPATLRDPRGGTSLIVTDARDPGATLAAWSASGDDSSPTRCRDVMRMADSRVTLPESEMHLFKKGGVGVNLGGVKNTKNVVRRGHIARAASLARLPESVDEWARHHASLASAEAQRTGGMDTMEDPGAAAASDTADWTKLMPDTTADIGDRPASSSLQRTYVRLEKEAAQNARAFRPASRSGTGAGRVSLSSGGGAAAAPPPGSRRRTPTPRATPLSGHPADYGDLATPMLASHGEGVARNTKSNAKSNTLARIGSRTHERSAPTTAYGHTQVFLVDREGAGGPEGGVGNDRDTDVLDASGRPTLRRDVRTMSQRSTNQWTHPAYMAGYVGDSPADVQPGSVIYPKRTGTPVVGSAVPTKKTAVAPDWITDGKYVPGAEEEDSEDLAATSPTAGLRPNAPGSGSSPDHSNTSPNLNASIKKTRHGPDPTTQPTAWQTARRGQISVVSDIAGGVPGQPFGAENVPRYQPQFTREEMAKILGDRPPSVKTGLEADVPEADLTPVSPPRNKDEVKAVLEYNHLVTALQKKMDSHGRLGFLQAFDSVTQNPSRATLTELSRSLANMNLQGFSDRAVMALVNQLPPATAQSDMTSSGLHHVPGLHMGERRTTTRATVAAESIAVRLRDLVDALEHDKLPRYDPQTGLPLRGAGATGVVGGGADRLGTLAGLGAVAHLVGSRPGTGRPGSARPGSRMDAGGWTPGTARSTGVLSGAGSARPSTAGASDLTLNSTNSNVSKAFRVLDTVFGEVDPDRSGKVSVRDFQSALGKVDKMMGLKLSASEMHNLVDDAIVESGVGEGGSQVDYQKFLGGYVAGAGMSRVPEFMKPKKTRRTTRVQPWIHGMD